MACGQPGRVCRKHWADRMRSAATWNRNALVTGPPIQRPVSGNTPRLAKRGCSRTDGTPCRVRRVGCRPVLRRRLKRIAWGRDRADRRRRGGRRPVAVPVDRTLLLVARAGTRDARQRRQVPEGRTGLALEPARRDKSSTGAAHRWRLVRMDTAKVKATAHQLARLICHAHPRPGVCRPVDLAALEAERRERMIVNLQRQAGRLELELEPAA